MNAPQLIENQLMVFVRRRRVLCGFRAVVIETDIDRVMGKGRKEKTNS